MSNSEENSYSDEPSLYTTYGLINILFHIWGEGCMWGKVPCDFLFSGARATSCFPSMFSVFSYHPPSHIFLLLYSSPYSLFFLVSYFLSSSDFLSSFFFTLHENVSGVGDIVGGRGKTYFSNKNNEKQWVWREERKPICGQVGFPFWKTFTMGVDLSPVGDSFLFSCCW